MVRILLAVQTLRLVWAVSALQIIVLLSAVWTTFLRPTVVRGMVVSEAVQAENRLADERSYCVDAAEEAYICRESTRSESDADPVRFDFPSRLIPMQSVDCQDGVLACDVLLYFLDSHVGWHAGYHTRDRYEATGNVRLIVVLA